MLLNKHYYFIQLLGHGWTWIVFFFKKVPIHFIKS